LFPLKSSLLLSNMGKRAHISDVAQTPGGVHFRFADVSADEIAIDEEISIKSSLFGTSTESHMRTRSSSRRKSLVTPKTKEKFVLRKSTDLRRFKTVEARVNAILSSPMIEVRRRPLGQSQSFTSVDGKESLFFPKEYSVDQPRTPLHVPKKNDPMAIASRRLSTLLLSKHADLAQSMPSLGAVRASVCPGALSRRRTSAFHTNTPVRRSEYFGSRSSVAPQTPVSPVQELAKADAEPDPIDDSENIPPENDAKPAPESASTERIEPSSVAEFRVLVDMEVARLKATKAAWEDVVEEEGSAIPDVALDSIRVAVGKCGLLIAKKFPFFHNLIDMADASLNPLKSATEESVPSADVNDLLGYWTTIASEIEQIDNAFERLRVWRENSKWALESQPKTPSRFETKKETTKPSSRLPHAKKDLNPSALPTNIISKIRAAPKSSKRLLRSSKKSASKIPAPSTSKRSNFAEFRAQLKAKRAETFKTPETPKVAKTASGHISHPYAQPCFNPLVTANRSKTFPLFVTPVSADDGGKGSSRNSQSGVTTSRSTLQTPLSFLRQMSPPPRPATGTPMPRIPKAAVSSTPAIVPPPAASLNHALSPYSLRHTRAGSAAKSTPGVRGTRKSVRFPEVLWATPGGHSGNTSRRISKSRRVANSTDPSLQMTDSPVS
uniref:Guanylate kinase-associated protein mars n=1 Tax=Schistocephalus solidus TaxID=70667 RepID=A0A183T7B5_SCHSO